MLLQLLGLLLLLLLLMNAFCSTVVLDDNVADETSEVPCDQLSGTRTPPTPDVCPSHAPPPCNFLIIVIVGVICI
jgi:hypothetical protein